jgi:ribosomal protein S18 acetylase RimI-like enzyme
MTIALRPVQPADEDFLYKIYASTRADEMAAWGWNPVQQEVFLRMQFNAQRRAYESQYPEAEHSIILLDEEMAGRLFVARIEGEIHLVDISILPEHRNAGAGTFLIRDLQSQAAASGRVLRLQVLQTNEAARRLYRRLNFQSTGESDVYTTMEWLPGN